MPPQNTNFFKKVLNNALIIPTIIFRKMTNLALNLLVISQNFSFRALTKCLVLVQSKFVIEKNLMKLINKRRDSKLIITLKQLI